MSEITKVAEQVIAERLPKAGIEGLTAEIQNVKEAGLVGFFLRMPHPDGKQVIVTQPGVPEKDASKEVLTAAFDEGVSVLKEAAEKAAAAL